MEENERTVEEEIHKTEEEAAKPSRDEILEMSREENKKGDERKKDVYKTGASLAFRAGIIIAIIFSVACLIVRKGELVLFPVYSVVLGMVAVNSIYIGKKENKKGLFILAIALAVLVAVLIVLSILMLCGVAL